MRGIAKRFGNVPALTGVDFSLQSGEIHALLGENGAGKSTLMHVLFGLTRADAGTVDVHGRALPGGSTRRAMAAGLGMVTQHFAQVPRMSVAQNVWLGRSGLLYRQRDAERTVRRVGEATGLALDPAAIAGELAVGLRQRLEIVKALSREVRVLILDEPTAALAPGEADELFAALRRLVSSGLSVVLITHKLREIAGVADRVTVLRRGEVALTSAARDLSAEDLARAMIGEGAEQNHVAVALEARAEAVARDAGEPALRVRSLTVRGLQGRPDPVREVTFEARAGEIIGIAAVEGNGQRELLRAVAGLMLHAGDVQLVRAGAIGFVPEDRRLEGLIPELSLAENLALGQLPRLWIDRRAEQRRADDAISAFRIQAAGRASLVETLSGGNQQKVVLARALGERPSLLVAENPTRGLDIRAAAEVHALLVRAARTDGTTVLFHSPDLDEVIALADRVAVMVGGGWRWVEAKERSRERIGALMLGSAA